ncbi:GTP-binding protein YchF [Nadsonia fulvescens var. elongata DSM 6958]|uniref:Obg-like ATPase homolog n=1 Tax=Nadsonia fulvescens var. elongata DSM 6958 TaxID=857566 RepID=A0A1E3PID1_9ASCO|nr:GTP-binding protein YchF [Nadsonia fulvescens var. elongata DSM 6958]
MLKLITKSLLTQPKTIASSRFRSFCESSCALYAKKLTTAVSTDNYVALGRPGNNLTGGIVGLANVGKSTFFQAITQQSKIGDPANYPFATIEPEEARALVPSPRFDQLVDLYKPESTVSASLKVFDIAGLVRGASKGEGLGNEFLQHIRAVDGLFHVVRAFDDVDIIHIEKSVDPIRDLEIMAEELNNKDLEYGMSYTEVLERGRRGKGKTIEGKKLVEDLEIAQKVLDWIEAGNRVANGSWTAAEAEVINSMSLLTAKPMVYIANVCPEDYYTILTGGSTPAYLKKIIEWVAKHSSGSQVIPVSMSLEADLMNIESEIDKREYLAMFGSGHSALEDLQSAVPSCVQALRKSLGLISFFTVGKGEVREWTVRQGAFAPQAAGVIHGDLEKTFIKAEIFTQEDILAVQGDEAKLKSLGKVSSKGKDYVMVDGDIVTFRSGAGKRR